MMDSTHFYTVCSLFSYAGVLTADMHWTEDKNDAGFIAGWLQSANVCGRIVTSSLWGFVAQRYGAKPVLLLALVSLLVGGLLFGFCTDLVGAMCVRFIFFGLLNGWPVLMGPCAAAAAGDTRQTEVLGLIIAASSGTQLVGPGLGGWTYGWVPKYPAIVPSSIGCVLTVATFVLFCRVHGAFGASPVDGEENAPSPKVHSSSKVLLRWPVPLLIWMRVCQGFAIFGIFEAIPLWLISDKELGGLGLSEKEVGTLLSRSGLWSMVYFSFLLPLVMPRRLAPRFFSIVTSCIAGLAALILPYCTTVPTANLLHLLCASMFLSQSVVNIQFTNNTTGLHERSLVTGVAVTVETIGKASAPVVMSWSFAWSLQRFGKEGHDLVFLIMASLALMQLICCLCLPSSVDGVEDVDEVADSPRNFSTEKAPMTWKIGREEPNMTAVMHRRVSE